MTVTFINRSDKPVFLIFSNQTDIIAPNYSKSVELDSDRFTFSAYFDIPSNIKNFLFFKSIVLKYNFSLISEYEVSGFDPSGNLVMNLFQKVSIGNQTDRYSYVQPGSPRASITNISRRVYDEAHFIEEIRKSKKREKIANVLGKILYALSEIIPAAIVLLIVFFAAKFAISTRAAVIITSCLAGIGLVISVAIGLGLQKGFSFIGKLMKIKKTPKNKKMKGYRFYFDSDYISGVIADSKGTQNL